MFVPRILKRQVAEADFLQDVGVNIERVVQSSHEEPEHKKG